MKQPLAGLCYRNTLVGDLGAVHLVAGHDFHFGYKGEGNPQRLQETVPGQLGIGCDIIPKVEQEGITISSTYIRTLMAQGEMERANEFLGHPHTLTDRVSHGKKLGSSTLGFPTVNLPAAQGERHRPRPRGVCHPGDGLENGREPPRRDQRGRPPHGGRQRIGRRHCGGLYPGLSRETCTARKSEWSFISTCGRSSKFPSCDGPDCGSDAQRRADPGIFCRPSLKRSMPPAGLTFPAGGMLYFYRDQISG